MNFILTRDVLGGRFTLGEMTLDGKHFGYTCEDTDRHLEDGGHKIDGETAIPRGHYGLALSFSERFQKIMPIVIGVPDFTGIRIHGGNTAADTRGCPELGKYRTLDGVRDCKDVNEHLITLLTEAEQRGEACFLTVK